MTTVITDNLDIWTSTILTKSGAGRNGNGTYEAHGIRKLRELILELAVRGELAPQDPKDETADVVLQKIAKEKARLIKEGVIPEQKLLPEVNGDEYFSLPNGWEWTRLGEVTNYGVTDKAEPEDVAESTWVLDLEDVEKDTSRLLRKSRFTERPFRSSKNRFYKGDVIYGKLRPYLDKVLVADEDGVCTTEMVPLRGYIGISPFYLRLVMKTPRFIKYANESTHGMNLPRLGTDKARMALIPLAPVAEQHRVVAKVNELMAMCDGLEQQQSGSMEAHDALVDALLGALTRVESQQGFDEAWNRITNHFDTLFTTEHSIEQLKQTVLQLAVMSRLVQQDSNDEPASELLDSIRREKRRLISGGILREKGALPEISDNEAPYSLPRSWQWARLRDVAYQITDGAHHTPTYVGDGIPFLSVKDMSAGSLDFSDTRYISKAQHGELIKRCHPEKGDLLLTKIGTTGVPVLVDTDKEFSIFVSVALIKFPQEKISGSYLSLLIKSPLVKAQSEDGTEGVGNKNLVLRKIAAFVLPIPPLSEQRRIVAKVNELMMLCDALIERLSTAQAIQFQLADAIVEQAVA